MVRSLGDGQSVWGGKRFRSAKCTGDRRHRTLMQGRDIASETYNGIVAYRVCSADGEGINAASIREEP